MTTSITAYVWLLLAIIFEIIATSCLKLSDQFTKLIPTLLTITCYALAFYLLSLTLKTIPLGISYAIWSGMGIVLISMVGWLLFKQHLDFAACCGMALIILGVVVIQLFSNSVSH